MYAYFKKLDYFSTECIYAPFAARGLARDFVKDLEVITIFVLEMIIPRLLTLSLAQCMECYSSLCSQICLLLRVVHAA